MGGKTGSRVIRTVQAGGGSAFGEYQEGSGGDDRRAKKFCCDLQVESQGLADMCRGVGGKGRFGVAPGFRAFAARCEGWRCFLKLGG